MITIIQLIETLLYVYLFFSVGYLVLFAVASLFAVKKDLLATDRRHRFLVLIPSYKEDKVIGDTVQAALSQQYPQEYFRVMVISDQMNESTNDHLRSMGAEVLEIHYEESSKALALQSAIRSCQSDAPSDYVVILDADNIIASDYLEQVNRYTQQTQCKVLQTHRTAKNLNTSTAILDAAIEEMNNSIFRLGHVQLGFSSALIGSGMVMDYIWFAENIFHTHSAGEDKELEELLDQEHHQQIAQSLVVDGQADHQSQLGQLVGQGIEHLAHIGDHVEFSGYLAIHQVGHAAYAENHGGQGVLPGGLGVQVQVQVQRDQGQPKKAQQIGDRTNLLFPIDLLHRIPSVSSKSYRLLYAELKGESSANQKNYQKNQKWYEV